MAGSTTVFGLQEHIRTFVIFTILSVCWANERCGNDYDCDHGCCCTQFNCECCDSDEETRSKLILATVIVVPLIVFWMLFAACCCNREKQGPGSHSERSRTDQNSTSTTPDTESVNTVNNEPEPLPIYLSQPALPPTYAKFPPSYESLYSSSNVEQIFCNPSSASPV